MVLDHRFLWSDTACILNPAGTKINEGCVAGTKACGTVPTGTTHPTIPNQQVKMPVCFKYGY